MRTSGGVGGLLLNAAGMYANDRGMTEVGAPLMTAGAVLAAYDPNVQMALSKGGAQKAGRAIAEASAPMTQGVLAARY